MSDSVLIIGGGFTRAVTAIKLAELGCTSDITIVEPRAELGRGIAAGHVADWRRMHGPLVRNLLSKGLVQVHPVGFGIRADPGTGAVTDSTGQPSRLLFAVGHPLRGAAWESS